MVQTYTWTKNSGWCPVHGLYCGNYCQQCCSIKAAGNTADFEIEQLKKRVEYLERIIWEKFGNGVG